jgi:hypothetical protein
MGQWVWGSWDVGIGQWVCVGFMGAPGKGRVILGTSGKGRNGHTRSSA